MNIILNILSVIATFTIAQIFAYLFFNVFFFKVLILNKYVIANIQVKHILYFIITTILLIRYTEFYLPFKN